VSDEYQEGLEAFLRLHVTQDGPAGVVQAFHAVRRMRYFSGPDRTPLALLASGRGACTAKHLLLRDLLRRLGERASTELVQGDFTRGIPTVDSMPRPLAQRIAQGAVTDFHCHVIWHTDNQALVLDATWPDGLSGYGFAVNSGWQGVGGTIGAMPGAVGMGLHEDVLQAKQALIDTLSVPVALDRKTFLSMLSQWIDQYG
jgi:hypothetical protein